MKNRTILFSSLLLSFAVGYYALPYFIAKGQKSESHLVKLKKVESLKDFVLKAMNIYPKVKFSKERKEILANKIVSFSVKYIHSRSAQEQFISMLKIESNYNNSAKSKASAIGIAQILPSTFKIVSKTCNFRTNYTDIYNEDINLAIGACYFNQLLKIYNNPRLASIYYNGGGIPVKKYKKFGNINKESANYVIKVEQVKELASK